jgi:hypothetical protein
MPLRLWQNVDCRHPDLFEKTLSIVLACSYSPTKVTLLWLPEGDPVMRLDTDFPSFLEIKPPTTTVLFKPLLETLRDKTKGCPGKFVPCETVIRETLHRTGMNPENLSDFGSHEIGWFFGNPRSGLYKTVSEAFLNGTDRRNPFPITVQGDPGFWGLTPDGIRLSDPCFQGAANPTALFLERRLALTGGCNGGFMKTLRRTVSAKLQMSVAIGIVDDHVQTCLMRLIHRDALAGRIFAGLKISDSLIATYAVRSAYNDCRDSGTEPVSRSLLGARTERERVGRDDIMYEHSDLQVLWASDRMAEFASFDVVDRNAVTAAEVMEYESFWTRIEGVLRARDPESCPKCMNIVRQKAEGRTVTEIAKDQGMPAARVSAFMSFTKECVLRAMEEGSF